MIRVVVADDEENIRLGLARQLEEMNLDLEIIALCENGRQVMDAMDQHPDLLLIDINMPYMNGLECIEEIRAKAVQCILIIISGYDRFDYAQRAIQNKVDYYLLKPVDDDEFTQVIEEAVKTHYQRMEERTILSRFVNEENTSSVSVVGYIKEHYAQENLTSEWLEKQFGMSRSTLFKQIRQATGMSLVEYVTMLRIDQAKRLLAEEVPMKEIARRVGYSDPYYFSRAFKKATSLTPSDYRQQVKGERR